MSPELAKRIIRRGIINKSKVVLATPGIDTNVFSPTNNKKRAKEKLGIPPDNLVVTIAARFDPVKDHMTFLKTMEIATKHIPDITILIAQDPKINLETANTFAPTVKKEIDLFLNNNKEVADRVIFTGYKKDMAPIYRATDILVSSSLYESLGMILMEAASSGLPIVSTNKDGQRLIVKNSKSGFLVPIQNPQKLAEKVVILAKNKKLRENFARSARKHIVRHYSIEKYTTEIEKTYLALLGQKSS